MGAWVLIYDWQVESAPRSEPRRITCESEAEAWRIARMLWRSCAAATRGTMMELAAVAPDGRYREINLGRYHPDE